MVAAKLHIPNMFAQPIVRKRALSIFNIRKLVLNNRTEEKMEEWKQFMIQNSELT
jgi:hypothetical protein